MAVTILKRLLAAIPTILLVSIVVFLLVQKSPAIPRSGSRANLPRLRRLSRSGRALDLTSLC